MKLSNYTPKPTGLNEHEKAVVESYFFGNKERAFTNERGVVLNKTWQIARLTGISEARINRYIDKVLAEKRKKLNDEDS